MVDIFQGSNADTGWIYNAAVPSIVASSCLVPIFLEQRLWEPIFIFDNWVVLDIQANICCWEGLVFYSLLYNLACPLVSIFQWFYKFSLIFFLAYNKFLSASCQLYSVAVQVRSFFAAVKALSHKEVHYGSYATKEQVWINWNLPC